MIEASACAKINLTLRVGKVQADGRHELSGVFQSVLWFDDLVLEDAAQDEVRTPLGSEVIDGWGNLAWQALERVRDVSGTSAPSRLTLAKRIPVEAGLGGGSADAAAGLALGATRFSVEWDRAATLAPGLGSDVPFCFRGGLARVGGTGEHVESFPFIPGYALGLVVPPANVSTATVFRIWDEMGGPRGPETRVGDVPPRLRELGPLVNDLYPAAARMEPLIEEWRAELAGLWGRHVFMTGSGPTLFAFFADVSEAEEAQRVVPVGARDAIGTTPAPFGWTVKTAEGGMLDSRGANAADPSWGERIDQIIEVDPVSSQESSTLEGPPD